MMILILPLGEFKIQKGRGAAGHKGVQSIINELRTKDFWAGENRHLPEKGPSTSLGAGKPENVEKIRPAEFHQEEQKILKGTIKEITLRLAELAQGNPFDTAQGKQKS